MLSHVWLFATLWTVARQCRLSMGCSRQERQSGLPGPSPGGSPWPRGRTPISGVSCTASGFFTHWTVGEALSSNNPVLFALGELESISIAFPPVISYFKDWCLNFFEKYRNTIKLIREENDLFLLWSISLSRSWELLFKSVITERKSVSASLCKLHVCLWLFLGLSVFLRGGGGKIICSKWDAYEGKVSLRPVKKVWNTHCRLWRTSWKRKTCLFFPKMLQLIM